LGDDDRSLRRQQALDWLRQDLAWSDKHLDGGNAQANGWIVTRLRFWLVDPDLAGVHAKDALAKLPEEERERWQSFWSDVHSLLARVGVPE
jgi:hypothetical protein